MAKKDKLTKAEKQKRRANKPSRLDRIAVPKYSLGEELVNSISHGVGAGLAIAGMIFCLIKASTPSGAVASALYGAFMIILYTMSCIYHALSPRTRGKKVIRVLDHANVFLMEAGTYMPICLALIHGTRFEPWAWVTFGVVWAVTIVAIVFSSIDVDKYQMVGVVCNLILGWGALLLWPVLSALMPIEGIWLLIIGGVAYSIGAILYAIGSRMKWMHSIFHFYVLMGSIFHFFFIYLFCL